MNTDYHSNIRTAVAALLTEHPAAITPILAAIGDALEHHDPRRQAAA